MSAAKQGLREEMARHERCTDTCPLHHTLDVLDSHCTVDVHDDINKQIIYDATEFVDRLVRCMGDIDPLWQCRAELRGSCTNGLKTGRVDEIDFLLKMENIILRADEGWAMVPYGDGSLDCFTQLVLSNYEASSDIQVPFQNEVLISYTDDDTATLSAKQFKKKMLELLERTTGKLIKENRNSCGESDAVPHPTWKFTYTKHKCYVYLYPPQTNYSIKLDITPCVCFLDTNSTQHWLVPKFSLDNWSTVNEDPIELTNPSVRKTIRVIKLLRDSVDGNHTEIFRKLHCVLTKRADSYRCEKDLSKTLTQHYSRAHTRPVHSEIPSYAITGTVVTVVKSYRLDPGRPLCCLVLGSLAHFELIRPDGQYLEPYNKRTVEAVNKEVGKMGAILKRLSTKAGVELRQGIRQVVPSSYTGHSDFPTDIAEELKLDQASVSASPHPAMESSLPSGTESTVYRVNRQEFTTLIHRAAGQDKELRDALQKLRPSDELYVAVMLPVNLWFIRGMYFQTPNFDSPPCSVDHMLERYEQALKKECYSFSEGPSLV